MMGTRGELVMVASSEPLRRPTWSSWDAPRMVLLYGLFAFISTAINLGAQQIGIVMLEGRVSDVLHASLLCGTVMGFASKYLLDKHFVFCDRSTTRVDEVRKLVFYGVFSVVTTVIFWGCELGFNRAFGTPTAKYAGAVIGLAIGYAAKFALDRRFTFTEAQE